GEVDRRSGLRIEFEAAEKLGARLGELALRDELLRFVEERLRRRGIALGSGRSGRQKNRDRKEKGVGELLHATSVVNRRLGAVYPRKGLGEVPLPYTLPVPVPECVTILPRGPGKGTGTGTCTRGPSRPCGGRPERRRRRTALPSPPA